MSGFDLSANTSLSRSWNLSNSTKQSAFLKHLITRDPRFHFKYLKLSGKDLVELPNGLFDVDELEYLDLSPERQSGLFFHLVSVPSKIGELKQLRVLCLDTNELKKVPAELGNLNNLEILVLSNNLLTSLPEELEKLSSLKSLHLANNFFSSISSCIFSMRNLQFLELSDNKITSIPDDVINLKKLEVLILLYNLLETVPANIASCVRLRNLWLGYNRLTSLPREIVNLERLDWTEHMPSSNINGNPLRHPPIDVCRRGLSAIKEYFKEDDKQK